MGFIQKNDGAISIFLCIVMMANIILAAVLIEGTAMKWSESQIQEAVEVSSKSTLAGYQTMLKNLFGVFAMAENNPEYLDEGIENYLNKTLMTELGVDKDALEDENFKFLKGLFIGNDKFKDADFMNLYDYRVDGVNAVPIHNLTENQILKQQILEYMKYRAPKMIAEGFLDKIASFKDFGKQSEIMSSKTKLDKELNTISEYQKELSDCIAKVNEFNTSIDSDFKKNKYMESELKKYKNMICDRLVLEKKKAAGTGKLSKKEISKIDKKISADKTNATNCKMKMIKNAKKYIEYNKDCFGAIDNIRENSDTALASMDKMIKEDLKDDKSDFAIAMKNEIKGKRGQIDKVKLAQIEKKIENNIKLLENFIDKLSNFNQDSILESQLNSGDLEIINDFVEKKISYSDLKKAIEQYDGTCNKKEIIYMKSKNSTEASTKDDPREDSAEIVKSKVVDVKSPAKVKLKDKDLVSKNKSKTEKETKKVIATLNSKDRNYFGYLIKNHKVLDPYGKTIQISDLYKSDSSGANTDKSKDDSASSGKIVEDVEFTEDKSEGFSENGLDFAANLGLLVKNSLVGIRDNLYLNEYIMGTFKNTLTNKKPKESKNYLPERDLRDILKNSRKTFLKTSEVEYILTGNSSESFNEYAIKAEILLIRFALNTLYIYMDAQKSSIALEAATAIAGWTGFGVPIVQTLIMLAWAMAESVVDVTAIMNCEKVPLYKTKETWVLGEASLIKAFVGQAASKIAEVGENAVDLGIDSAADISKTMIKRTDELIKSKIKIAVDNAFSPVENILNNATKEAGDMLDDASDSITALNKDASTMKTIEEKIYNFAQSKFEGMKESLKEKLIKMPSEKAAEYLYNAKQKIISEIYGRISNLIKKLNKEIDSISKKSKEKVNEFIEKTFGKISNSATDTDFKSCILSLGYGDYLRIFLLAESENTKLDRIEDLIQLNMRKETGFNKFQLKNYNTSFRLETDISYKFIFSPGGLLKSSNEGITRHTCKTVIYQGYY